MIKIVALNDNEKETNDDEEQPVTREAQETIAESEYIRAIKLKTDGDTELCLHLLKELLQTQVLNENIKNNRNNKLWSIKYNCHKNIALILEERLEYMLALQHYISAILIDNSDVSTLYKFGQLALKCNVTDLAEFAFENCIGRNSSHFCAAEGMLQVMNVNHNIIGSYTSARKMCEQNMKCEDAVQTLTNITNFFNSNLSFLKKCSGFDSKSIFVQHNQQQPGLTNIFHDEQIVKIKNVHEVDQVPDLKKFGINEPNWYSLGQFIVHVYSYLHDIKHDALFVFNLNDFIESSYNADLTDMTKDLLERTSADVNEVKPNVLETDGALKGNEPLLDQTKTCAAEKCDVQPMDYNNDDSDSNIKSDGSEANKVKPRRRCSDLHFLEQWGWHKNRRYSSRKKNERDEIDTSLNGYLRKLLIKYTSIPIEDKWPFGEISEIKNTYDTECNKCKIPVSKDSFNVSTRNELDTFLNKIKDKCIDIMELTYRWLKYISLAWSLPLPYDLKVLYINIFKIYISHFNFSTWNLLTPINYEASYRICILYLELSVGNRSTENSELWSTVFHQLLFNIGNFRLISKGDIKDCQLKLIYLEYIKLNEQHHNKECVSCLKQMLKILEHQEPSYILHLPNLNSACINIDYVKSLQLLYERQIDVNNIPKFYENGSWDKLEKIIINNIESSENKCDNESWLKDICAQMEILLQSFWIMESYENCLIWSEKCLHFAVSNYLEESKLPYRCTLLAQLINFITSYMEAIILKEGFHFVSDVKTENLSRMVQNIIRILVYQFDGLFEKTSNHGRELNFKRPWVILHQLILREENDSPSNLNIKSDDTQDVNDLIPKSFLILFTAHEYLGKRQWCTDDDGEFLQYILDAVVLNLKAPIYDVCRDIIYEYLEQVTYCLFKYPQKKARLRHLEDHEAAQVKLSWLKAIQIFDLYRPEDLPEFNSYKLESITSEMEQLLLKIISLMPTELDPSKSIHYVTMFIEGRLESPPGDSNAFKLPYKILSLYYLLADFYFKNRDFVKAIKFYTLDLAVNPARFDSWAGMALSKASKIETKLNGLDPISMETIWEECEEVLRCFECCINLNRFQTLLWIEYGSFSYTIHSCFSRYIKCNSKNMADETLTINERKNKMLTIAFNCFSLANSLQYSVTSASEDNADANDEKWLCQYMLGKISEKRKEQPKVYLNHYLMAANYLYENSATYPIKINHSNPTTLSVEALEVFYRINAAIIKYLQNEKEITRCTGDLFNKILKSLSNSPFAFNKAKIDGNSLNIFKRKPVSKFKPPSNYIEKREENSSAPNNKISANESLNNLENAKSFEEIKEKGPNSKPYTKERYYTSTSTVIAGSGSTSVISSDSSTAETESDSDDSFTDNENNIHIKDEEFTPDELKVVYRMVVQNIEECATRFPEHYKSIYRLIYHYMNSSADHCDLAQSEQLLLGQYKTSLGNLVNGLFYDRKNNNLFNGIWRIPSSEIDRPGSFSAHLVKCVKIFIQLLHKTNNQSILIDLAMNLYKTPDLDKRYITDAERKELCQQSITYSIDILRSILQRNIDKRDDTDTLNLLLDIYKIHKKCVKYMNQKEPMFAELLVEVYKLFIKDKVECIPDNCNFLDLAIKLCVQEITAQKNIENTSDFIVTQSSVKPNITASRIIHIPGINARPKFRGNTSRTATTTVSNLSAASNLPPTDLKNPQLFSMLQLNQLIGSDNLEFQKFFGEYYSKMLQNELNTCLPTTMNPSGLLENQMTNVLNNFNLILPHKQPNSSVSETPIHEHSSNVNEMNSLICNDVLLQNQLNSPLLKQISKPKISHRNKPYNRPLSYETGNNSFNDDSANHEIDILNNQVSALEAYSNLFQRTDLTKLDFSNKQHMNATNKISKEVLPETSTNMVSKEFQNDVGSENCTTQQVSSSHFTSTSLIRNQFSNQQYTNSLNFISPTKTLQEKLAERQKAYQQNETSLASTSSTSSKYKSSEDVIVLDD